MATVNTNDLRVANAKNLISSFFSLTKTVSNQKDNLIGVDSDGSILGPDDYGANAVMGANGTDNPVPDDLLATNASGSLLMPNNYENDVTLAANGRGGSSCHDEMPGVPVIEVETSAFVFIGRPMPWEFDMTRPEQPGILSGDEVPPTPDNSLKEFYQTYDQMISMKRVDPEDVFHMIPKIKWASGLVYDMYRHDYSIHNRATSNASNLFDAKFFVINQNNDVYACLDNNEGSPSTVEPTFMYGSSNPQFTSDGYQWLYLYALDEGTLRNYSTQNYMPIYDDGESSLESKTMTDGAVYTVTIVDRGLGYTNSPGGVPNEVPQYFCNIVGDGSGAVCRVTVFNGRVIDVRVVRNGSGYTRATVDFRPGFVYRTLADLDAQVNGLNPRGDGTFRADVIISPPGGWGYDFAYQLGGTRVGVFSTLNYNQLDFLPDTSYRQIGIMRDIDSDSEEETLSAHYKVKVIENTDVDQPGPGTDEIDYIIGETIYQSRIVELPDGTEYTQTAKGTVAGWNKINNIISYIQDPQYHADDDGILYRFTSNDKIVTKRTLTFPGDRDKIVTPDTSFNRFYVSQQFIAGYAEPEVDKYTGRMLYLTNLSPIKRQPTQTERVNLIISY